MKRNWAGLGLILWTLLPAAGAWGAQVQLNVGLGRSVFVADQKQTTFLKVGLMGFTLDERIRRSPVNIALVLDKSGSMAGEKLAKAKDAALNAIERLDANDIVSVVTYDSTVHVLVPATKLTDKSAVRAAIMNITADGSTALFGGVSKGSEEVRKFLDKTRVNRVILLTDGLAKIGPSSPSEVASLGGSLKKEGIAVTTLGLGLDYNEDLLVQLAARSDGNHSFIKSAADMAVAFNREFGDVLSVVAQEVVIRIQCAEGIRPVRVLGRDAEISGQSIYLQMNQLYSKQEKFLIVEVEVPATPEGRTREVASVNVSYANMATHTTDKLASSVSAAFTRSPEESVRSENKTVMIDAIEQKAVEQSTLATMLRDKGQIEEARKVTLDNASILRESSTRYDSAKLKVYADNNLEDSKKLEDKDWGVRRKMMSEKQNDLRSQTSK